MRIREERIAVDNMNSLCIDAKTQRNRTGTVFLSRAAAAA